MRAFLSCCVYYRIWVRNFAIVAKPLYKLLKKNIEFVWTQECEDAMEIHKEALTNAPALATLDYADDAGEIILVVDASGKVGVPYCNKSKMEKGTRCDMKVVFGPNQRKSTMLGSANVEHYFERSKS